MCYILGLLYSPIRACLCRGPSGFCKGIRKCAPPIAVARAGAGCPVPGARVPGARCPVPGAGCPGAGCPDAGRKGPKKLIGRISPIGLIDQIDLVDLVALIDLTSPREQLQKELIQDQKDSDWVLVFGIIINHYR